MNWSMVGLTIMLFGWSLSASELGAKAFESARLFSDAERLDVVAPSFPGTSSVADGKVGMIIFDLSTNSFKGLDNAGSWSTFVSSTTTVPAGAVSAYAGTSAPSGYLLCNGSAVSRSTYAALFAAIGTAHGNGDGSTTFNLPDYRGRFLRGVDGGSGNDPDASSRIVMGSGGNSGNLVGSIQGHAFQTHTHTDSGHTHVNNQNTWGQNNSIAAGSGGAGWAGNGGNMLTATGYANIQSAYAAGLNAQPSSSETRAVNAYVNYIIKY